LSAALDSGISLTIPSLAASELGTENTEVNAGGAISPMQLAMHEEPSYSREMERSNSALHRIPWLTLLLGVAAAGCVAVFLAWLLLPTPGVVATVGFLVCVHLAVTVANCRRATAVAGTSQLETPFLLARDADMFQRYQDVSESLLIASRNPDPIYREIALEHFDELNRKATTIAEGTFVFEGTETWRIVYERLLRSPGLHLYRSVAWVKNANYWQDEPGRKSMAVNFELHEAERLNIERIAIIADELWLEGEVWPEELVCQWLHEQHARGIWIKFVRESALAHEPDLIADIGIYGSRALGIQELDEQCRTVRFTLTFDFASVSAAEERWKRLSIYAESFANYLDRYEMP